MATRSKKLFWLGVVAAGVIIVIVAVRAYYSPYQTCLRSLPHDAQAPLSAKQQCAQEAAGR